MKNRETNKPNSSLYFQLFEQEELENGAKYARCPSCSLMVEVIFNPDDLESIMDTKSSKKDTKANKPATIKSSE